VVCAVALAGFVVLARPSPSVIRAAAMGGIALVALAVGRSRSAMPALALAVVVGLLIDPALSVDAGFALSVLATGALVLLAPGWRDRLVARGVPPVLAEALAVPAAAQVACGPVIVALSGQVSLVAVPANLLAAPAVAPATLLGVGAALISPLWSDGAGMLAWLAAWPARWLVAIATTGASVPDGALPWPGGAWGALGLAGLTVGLFVAARRPVARRILVAGALAVAVGAVPVRLLASGWPPAGAVVVACDVGQGDALVLPDAPGEAVVIDSGPDPPAVDGCLRRLGVRAVAALVLTHFHADHVGGVTGVLDGRTVAIVVLPTYHEPDTGYRTVLDAVRGRAPVTEAGPGWTLRRGGLELRAIGPTRTLTGTRSDPNNNSLVLRATSHGVSVLLAGDAETEEQGELLADDAPRRPSGRCVEGRAPRLGIPRSGTAGRRGSGGGAGERRCGQPVRPPQRRPAGRAGEGGRTRPAHRSGRRRCGRRHRPWPGCGACPRTSGGRRCRDGRDECGYSRCWPYG
jgi:competence protein ComEC